MNQNNNKKIELKDLMSADQALRIIELLEDLDKRVSALETDSKMMRQNLRELEWKEIYTQVSSMMTESYPSCIKKFEND